MKVAPKKVVTAQVKANTDSKQEVHKASAKRVRVQGSSMMTDKQIEEAEQLIRTN